MRLSCLVRNPNQLIISPFASTIHKNCGFAYLMRRHWIGDSIYSVVDLWIHSTVESPGYQMFYKDFSKFHNVNGYLPSPLCLEQEELATTTRFEC